jgi:hypothetical protein
MLTRSPLRTLSLEHVFLACEQVTHTEYNMKFSTTRSPSTTETSGTVRQPPSVSAFYPYTHLKLSTAGRDNVCELDEDSLFWSRGHSLFWSRPHADLWKGL